MPGSTTPRSGARRLLARLGWFFDDRRFAWTWFVLLAVLFSVYYFLRVDTYLIAGYDSGIFDQVVRHYAHFEAPMVTLKGDDYNIWGDHFHPIIALWAPLYWIWDNIRMLGVGQALVVAATVFPLWRFLRRHVGSPRWGKVFVIAIMFFWPIESMIDFEVHEVAFALPLLAWIIDALERRDDRVLLICSGLLLLVREDMGTVVFMAGLVRFFWARRLRRGAVAAGSLSPARAGTDRSDAGADAWPAGPTTRKGSLLAGTADGAVSSAPRWLRRDWLVGLGLMVAGLVVFWLITSVVIPHFSATGFAYWDYPDLGDGPAGAVMGALTHPWRVVELLFYHWDKTLTWACLLVPLALLPLRSPFALLGAPIMVSRMLAGRWTLWSVHYHYNAPVWIIAALAAVDAIGRLRPARARRWYQRCRSLFHLPRGVAPVGALQEALAKLVTVVLIGGLILGTVRGLGVVSAMFPFQRLVTGATYRMDDQQRARAEVVAWIPADTCVAADDYVAGQLTHSNRVTLPGLSAHHQDFYALDLSKPDPGTTTVNWTTQQSYDYAVGLGYQEVFRADPIVVLQAPDYTGPDPSRCGPDVP